MNREEKLARNTIVLGIGTFFPKLATFLALPILTAQLSKVEYGVFDLCVTLVSLVLPLATVQIHTAAFRFLIDVQKDEDEKETIITNIYVFVLITSLVCLACVFAVLWKQPLMIRIGVCLYYFFDIVSNVNKQIARGLLRNFDYTISSIISGLGQIVMVLIMVMGLKKGLSGALLALAMSEFFSMAYLFIRSKIAFYISWRKFNAQRIKELLAYSWPMVPNSLSQWVIHASDRLVITEFMGVAANAVYSVAYKIPSILSLAQTTFNMAWQENASVSANDADVSKYYSSMFKVLFNIISGMMSMLIGMTPILFWMFVRGDYAEAYFQMPILFVGMFFLCLSTFWGGIFVAMKQTKPAGMTTVIAALINLTIDLVCVKKIGLYAGSISSVTAYFVMCLLRAKAVSKLVRIEYDMKHILVIVGVLIVQCVLCFWQQFFFNVVNLLIGFVLCMGLNFELIKKLFKKISKRC